MFHGDLKTLFCCVGEVFSVSWVLFGDGDGECSMTFLVVLLSSIEEEC